MEEITLYLKVVARKVLGVVIDTQWVAEGQVLKHKGEVRDPLGGTLP
jgi:hypothetical protein